MNSTTKIITADFNEAEKKALFNLLRGAGTFGTGTDYPGKLTNIKTKKQIPFIDGNVRMSFDGESFKMVKSSWSVEITSDVADKLEFSDLSKQVFKLKFNKQPSSPEYYVKATHIRPSMFGVYLTLEELENNFDIIKQANEGNKSLLQ